jgi:hypothetical protein
VTADGELLRLYENGQPVAAVPCSMMAASESQPIWFGTDADGIRLWEGRIDELALFDRTLGADDIAELYQAALDEIAEDFNYVTDSCIAPLGTAEHLDTHHRARTSIVGNVQDGLHLNHVFASCLNFFSPT